jgi:hypothetical protein
MLHSPRADAVTSMRDNRNSSVCRATGKCHEKHDGNSYTFADLDQIDVKVASDFDIIGPNLANQP